MLKRLVLVISLALGGSVVGLVIGQSKAFACTNGSCGYFANGNDSSWCNVLPDPSIKAIYGTGNCWLSSSGGNGHSLLYGDNTTAAFIADINSYLYQTGGNGGYNLNSQTGAAFLIDYMMGIDFHAVSPSTGITDARANFAKWSSAIQALSVNSCAITTQMTCPGKSFGVNWTYQPPYFCSSPVTTSGYDPWVHDATLYNTTAATCDHDWRASVPEIVFYWNNGANSFHIGSQCGNAQSRANKLPLPDQLPTATITVACGPGQQQIATVNFSDADGATTGFITINGWTSGTVPSGSAQQIPIPTSVTDPVNAQNVFLHVRDVGPLAPPNTDAIFQASTSVPCVSYGCAITFSPLAIDPYMTYQASVSITTTGNGVPAGSTVALQITPPAGVVYSYNKTQGVSGSGSPVVSTFSSIPATGRTGIYSAQATVTASTGGITCNATFAVVNLPYLQVYGGDVFTGESPDGNASACGLNAQAGIFSWTNHAAGYAGAGTQYAVQALAQIQDFATAQGSGINPTGLSLANSPASLVDLSTGLFGGSAGALNLDANKDCIYTNDPGVATVGGGSATTTITNLPPLLANGSKTIMYANSDVYISRNISYNTSGWGAPGDIPSFKLVVVGGNIYIGAGVTKLDGIYAAELKAGVGGGIYTCAKGNSLPWNPSTDYATGYYQACKQQLVVTGAFIAKTMHFLRTYGSVGQSSGDTLGSNHAGEVFQYTPELWLPRGANVPDSGYDAITGLPPIL